MDLKSVLNAVLKLLLSAVLTLLVYAVFPAHACMGRSLDYGLIFGIPLGVLMSRALIYGKIKGIGDFLYNLLVAVAIGYFIMVLMLTDMDWVLLMYYISTYAKQICTSIL